jgi:hypothetical protein
MRMTSPWYREKENELSSVYMCRIQILTHDCKIERAKDEACW